MKIAMVIIVRNMHASLFYMLVTILFSFPSYAQTFVHSMPLFKEAVPDGTLKQYPILSYRFIDLIKAIPKPLPASLDDFQKIFNNQLRVAEKDNFFITYRMRTFITLDKVIIKNAGLTIDLNTNKVTWFGMSLDQKQCINTNLLKKEFDFLVPDLLETPLTSTSLIGLYTTDEWGQFLLSTNMSSLNCVSGIGMSVFF